MNQKYKNKFTNDICIIVATKQDGEDIIYSIVWEKNNKMEYWEQKMFHKSFSLVY